jgi:hypothetical protein
MKPMRGKKTTLNKAARSESETVWKSMGSSAAEDQRSEVREQITGDILWSYVADNDKNLFKGTVIDESESGLCLLTLAPLRVGSTLRISGDGRKEARDATVIWCKKGSADIYKSGLWLGEGIDSAAGTVP